MFELQAQVLSAELVPEIVAFHSQVKSVLRMHAPKLLYVPSSPDRLVRPTLANWTREKEFLKILKIILRAACFDCRSSFQCLTSLLLSNGRDKFVRQH